MLKWQLLPVPVYDYPKGFCVLHLWASIFKDTSTRYYNHCYSYAQISAAIASDNITC